MIDLNIYKYKKEVLKGIKTVDVCLIFPTKKNINNKEIWSFTNNNGLCVYKKMKAENIRAKFEKEIILQDKENDSLVNKEAVMVKFWDVELNVMYCSAYVISKLPEYKELMEPVKPINDGMLPPNPIDGHRRWL